MMPEICEITLSILVGLGLSAACGFRIFIPLLVVSLAGYAGHLSLGDGFEWLCSLPAVISLSVATLLEIVAYYVPVVDHFLDMIGTPAAAIAGAILAGSFASDISPWFQWGLVAVAGAGLATVTHAGMATVRGAVSGVTATTGNAVVSTVENVTSAGMSVLMALMPVVGGVAAAVLLVFLIWGLLWLFRRRRRKLAATMDEVEDIDEVCVND